MSENNRNKAAADAQLVCPWWLCFTFDNALRRWLQNPTRIVRPYLKEGDRVLDVGPGMGYFTLPMAAMVGDKGRVIAADLQQHMLDAIRKRALKAGLSEHIKYQRAAFDSLNVHDPVDFALAFWMVHEVPDKDRLLKEILTLLKPGGRFLLVEPQLHVNGAAFRRTLDIALKTGFSVAEKPRIFISNAVVLKKLND
jgi:ubiquinone/menaquinone biosynthesis C-methylase UbiE